MGVVTPEYSQTEMVRMPVSRIDLHTVLFFQRLRHFRRGHRSVKAALFTALHFKRDHLVFQGGSLVLCFGQQFRLTGVLRRALALDLLQRAGRGFRGQFLGKQEVPGIPVADRQDIVSFPNVLDIFQQYNLHVESTSCIL